MNRRAVTWPPAEDQHLRGFVAADAMAPVVAFFKADVGLQFFGGKPRVLEPVVKLFE